MKTGIWAGVAAVAAAVAAANAGGADLSQEPASFTVARSDIQNQYPVLSWTLPAGVTNTVVYRAYGEGGPWSEIAETDALAATYTDETAPVGVPCWYKIAFAETVEEVRTVGNMCAATVSHQRCQLLERDWSDMTKVKDGVTVIWNSNGKIYNNGDNRSGSYVTRETVEESVHDAFDGDTVTHPNVAKGTVSGRTAVGVDMGEECFIAFARCYPRTSNATMQGNFNGITIYGSNDSASWYSSSAPAVTEAVKLDTKRWYEVASTNMAPFRYVYAHNPSKPSWCLAVCELQFYGWPASAAEGYPVGAVDLAAVQDGTSVALSWKDNGYGTTFNVERSTDGGETWTAVASGLSATVYEDADVALDGTDYLYRIASVSGEAVSYSATVRCVPYVHGDGEGLHRSALFPFIMTGASEMAEYVSTGAVSIAAATLDEERPIIDGVEGSHTNVYVTWTGRLVVPFAGTYVFRAVADGMVSVWIDDANVTRYSVESGLSELTGDAITLSAGEHDIRVAYWQGASSSGCELFWGGAVAEEPIPVSQLKPVAPNALPDGWEGARIFTGSAADCYPSDIRVNDDGSFDFAFTGTDINYNNPSKYPVRGHSFLWRPVRGDFVMTARLNMRESSWLGGEKAGLMVAANLTSTSPFEAFLLRGNKSLGLRARRASLSEPVTIGGVKAWGVGYTSKTIYIRLRRKGSKFTYSYRASKSAQWTDIYEYDDTTGYYGDTVYAGPVATCVSTGWTSTSTYRTARYAWRFSETDVRPTAGTAFLLR